MNILTNIQKTWWNTKTWTNNTQNDNQVHQSKTWTTSVVNTWKNNDTTKINSWNTTTTWVKMANKTGIQNYLPQEVRETAYQIKIPYTILKSNSGLVTLILESKAISTTWEKQERIQSLLIMTDEQISELENTLRTENLKLELIEKKYWSWKNDTWNTLQNIDYVWNWTGQTQTWTVKSTWDVKRTYKSCITPWNYVVQHWEYVLAYQQRTDVPDICNVQKRVCKDGKLWWTYTQWYCNEDVEYKYTKENMMYDFEEEESCHRGLYFNSIYGSATLNTDPKYVTCGNGSLKCRVEGRADKGSWSMIYFIFDEKFHEYLKNMSPESKRRFKLGFIRAIMGAYTYQNSLFSQEEMELNEKIKLFMEENVSDNKICDFDIIPGHYNISCFMDDYLTDSDKFFLKDKDIIDAGAFIGDSALPLSKLTSKNVYAFEPFDESYEKMEQNIELNNIDNIIPVKASLTDKNEDITLYLSGNNVEGITSNSSIRKYDTELVVKGMTIDKFVEENNLDVGFIKIDVEGGEQALLRGAINTIKSQKPIIYVSIYHTADDFFNIKPWIDNLNLGYEFEISKERPNQFITDTVLECRVHNNKIENTSVTVLEYLNNYDYKFSVVIAIYNTEKYLNEAIDSVINQTIGFEDNIELILVDDGSTDSSGEICKQYQEKYPNNIKYIYQENQGQANARNNGMKIAKGAYLNFLDSDDKFVNNALSTVEQYVSKEPNIITAKFYRWLANSQKKKPIFVHWLCSNKFFSGNTFQKKKHLLRTGYSFPLVKFYKTDLFYKSNIKLEENISFQDSVFFHAMVTNCSSWQYINKYLGLYRDDRPDSSSNSQWNINRINAWIKTINNLDNIGATANAYMYCIYKPFRNACKAIGYQNITAQIMLHNDYQMSYIWKPLHWIAKIVFKKITKKMAKSLPLKFV